MPFISKKLSLIKAPAGPKEKEAALNSIPNEPLPPPSYKDSEQMTTVQDITAGFSNLKLSSTNKSPSRELAIAHLKLLEAFRTLKDDVGYNDGLFGIWESRASSDEYAGMKPEEALAKIREKRWSLYVARAAERFETWWLSALCKIEGNPRRLTQKDMLRPDFESSATRGKAIDWKSEYLPPLDVLMVWHSFMLNPRSYLEDCIRFGLVNVYSTGLPWVVVNGSIDTDFKYSTTQAAKHFFETNTGLAWDNLDGPLNKTLRCPRCTQTLDVPWTTCDCAEEIPYGAYTGLVGSGYGESEFSFSCHGCALELNHEVLRVAKFKKDTEMLLLNDWPLGGTIIDSTSGVPTIIPERTEKSFGRTFPNRLIGLELKTSILEVMNNFENPNMKRIRDYIEVAISNRSTLRRISQASISGRLLMNERVAVRKMMSRYWENHSVFALDLTGAVLRQGIFVDKMHSIDWIHSPALDSTVTRLIEKYYRFFSIMATFPKNVAVPTLDVDLAWHTHQLSPRQYYKYSMDTTKKFTDHDDKIDEDKLSESFEWTSKTYEKLFGEVYSMCSCWYCEGKLLS
jgi:hypothetical protein